MDLAGQRSSAFGSVSADARGFIALFRDRLREKHFWAVQALVLGITALHGLLEASEVLGEHEAMSFIPVSFYFIPVVYAGLNFGMAGALPTALWIAVLAIPNLMVWHYGTERIGELTQLSILVGVAVLVARRVDEESRAKARAEQVSARLAQLNATAAAVSRSLEPAQVVREVLEAVLRQGRADVAWIAIPHGTRRPLTLTVLNSRGEEKHELPPHWAEPTERTVQTGLVQGERRQVQGQAATEIAHAAVFPVTSVDRVLGALGAACESDSLSEEDVNLLEAVAHQLAVALDNTGHFQEAKSALADLTQAEENLRAYLRLATEAQEEERKRLARELHDDTVQSLVVIRSSLDAIAMEQRLPVGVNERLGSLKKLMDAAVEDIRRFSRDLRPSLLDDLGLVHAIDWLVKDMGTRTGIAADLEVEGDPRRLRGDTEVAVYRIVQEALRNVERHSRASTVSVSLDFGRPDLVATISDNGHGFDVSEVLRHRGAGARLGIVGMQERAKLVAGGLTIESDAGKGTLVTVRMDAEASESAMPPN
jgi:signal transduction histidine kinase